MLNTIRRREKEKKIRKLIFICISMMLLFFTGFSITYAGLLFAKVNTQELPTDNASLGISEEDLEDIKRRLGKDEIMNIALFGIDTRNPAEHTRSDSIIIATIDYKHKKIKLSSILRDTRVNIEGHGMQNKSRICSWWSPSLLLKPKPKLRIRYKRICYNKLLGPRRNNRRLRWCNNNRKRKRSK